MYENYIDWIFPFVGEFLRKKEKMHFYLNYTMAQMFAAKMKDNLIEFELKYYKYIRHVRPEYFHEVEIWPGATVVEPIEGYITQVCTCHDIYDLDLTAFDDFSVNYRNKKPIVPVNSTPLVGSVQDINLIQRVTLVDKKYESLSLDISEVSMNIADSLPTGDTNMGIPQDLFVGKQIVKRRMPKDCQFSEFLSGVEAPRSPQTETQMTEDLGTVGHPIEVGPISDPQTYNPPAENTFESLEQQQYPQDNQGVDWSTGVNNRVQDLGNNNSESETTDTKIYGLINHDEDQDICQAIINQQHEEQMRMFDGENPVRRDNYRTDNNNQSENNQGYEATGYDPAMGDQGTHNQADEITTGCYPPRNEDVATYPGNSEQNTNQGGSESEQNRGQGQFNYGVSGPSGVVSSNQQTANPKSGFSGSNPNAAIPLPHSNMITNNLASQSILPSGDQCWDVNYTNSPYAIKLMLSNSTDNYYSFSLRMLTGEQTNLHVFEAPLAFSIRPNKTNYSFMYLHKIDAKKPIGEFTLILAHKKIDHHDHMMPTVPVFADADDRQTVTVRPMNITHEVQQKKQEATNNQDSGNNNQESETQDTQGGRDQNQETFNNFMDDTETNNTGMHIETSNSNCEMNTNTGGSERYGQTVVYSEDQTESVDQIREREIDVDNQETENFDGSGFNRVQGNKVESPKANHHNGEGNNSGNTGERKGTDDDLYY